MTAVFRALPSTTGVSRFRFPSDQEKAALLDARVVYLQAWAELDTTLLRRAGSRNRVLNFGAGMFSFKLACYCPEYWCAVEACIVEGQNGEFFGKQVYANIEAFDRGKCCLILGTRPSIQELLANRLQAQGYRCVRWNDLIKD